MPRGYEAVQALAQNAGRGLAQNVQLAKQGQGLQEAIQEVTTQPGVVAPEQVPLTRDQILQKWRDDFTATNKQLYGPGDYADPMYTNAIDDAMILANKDMRMQLAEGAPLGSINALNLLLSNKNRYGQMAYDQRRAVGMQDVDAINEMKLSGDPLLDVILQWEGPSYNMDSEV